MTIKRVNHGRNHSYVDTETGAKVPGVTTIIGDGLPKKGLINWAADATAEYALDRWDELAEMTPSKRLRALQGARYEDRDAAANRGREVHKLAESLAAGKEVEVPDLLRGHVESCIKFLDEWNVQPVLVEAVLVNYTHRWAGTLDLVADLADGRRWLLDYKTNRRGPYGDTAFQLAAYRNAEFYRLTHAHPEVPMVPVDACGVVWLRADGYELYPYEAGPRIYREFLYIQQVAQLAERSQDYRGEALAAPMRSRT